MRFLIPLLGILLYQGANPPKQAPEARNAGQQSQREINPLPSVSNAVGGATTEPKSDTNQTTTDNNWTHWITPIDPFSTSIIAIFTVLMYFNVRSQLQAAKIEKRAWLIPDIGSIEETKTKGTFQVICRLTNNGGTPAWVTAAGSFGLFQNEGEKLPEIPPYTPMGPFSKRGTLLPPTAWLPQGFPLTNSQLVSVAKKEKVLYVTGFIEYRDIYKAKHRTSYCYQLQHALDLTHPVPLDFYIAGPTEYNDAT